MNSTNIDELLVLIAEHPGIVAVEGFGDAAGEHHPLFCEIRAD